MKSNPKLDPELTAYTPGETVNLLNHPKIIEWFDKVRNFRIPENYKTIALVPCAKTKPWGKTRPKSSDLYNAYHEISEKNQRGELKIAPIYFVTISEPLGVVPQDFWDDFPQYDNPGLFADPVMRSGGLFTRDYSKTPIGTKHIIPFDEKAYEEAISKLGTTIGEFIRNNTIPGRVFVSFVEDPSGKIKTTHSHMLDVANIPDILPPQYRYDKPKGKTSKERIGPTEHYISRLQEVEHKRQKP